MIKPFEIRRAKCLIENVGDPVTYRGIKWFYLRKPDATIGRAVKMLEDVGLLKRWSKKTPNVVRFKEGKSDAMQG